MEPFKYKQILALLENNLKTSVDKLKDFKKKVDNNYSNTFSTESIFGSDCFDMICKNVTSEDYEPYLLSEKCIKRAYAIHNLPEHYPEDTHLKQSVDNADKLWSTFSQDILPLEIFWAMDYEFEDGESFSGAQWSCLNNFKYVANFYLEYTNIAFNKYLTPNYITDNIL